MLTLMENNSSQEKCSSMSNDCMSILDVYNNNKITKGRRFYQS